MNRPDLLSLDIPSLQKLCREWGLPAFRARQIFSWLHNKCVLDFARMSDLPLTLREQLAERAVLALPKIVSKRESSRGDTIKLLLEFADGERVETVLMLYARGQSRDRATCCISSQSGCAMGCTFCASGLFGQPRNLSAGEMAVQVILTAHIARERGFSGITNAVFMGMGEPLMNLDNVKQSILLLNEETGQNIGQRRITVSTCGLAPQIYALADWGLQVELAVSLHAADEALRKRLMPVASRWPLPELLKACRYYREKTTRRVTMEYALFAGVNDSVEQAERLAGLLRGEDVLINIIPANAVEEAGFFPSKREIIEMFCAVLAKRGCHAAEREARGLDIDAACGQLRKCKIES